MGVIYGVLRQNVMKILKKKRSMSRTMCGVQLRDMTGVKELMLGVNEAISFDSVHW